jgi:hypothetical protein
MFYFYCPDSRGGPVPAGASPVPPARPRHGQPQRLPRPLHRPTPSRPSGHAPGGGRRPHVSPRHALLFGGISCWCADCRGASSGAAVTAAGGRRRGPVVAITYPLQHWTADAVAEGGSTGTDEKAASERAAPTPVLKGVRRRSRTGTVIRPDK